MIYINLSIIRVLTILPYLADIILLLSLCHVVASIVHYLFVFKELTNIPIFSIIILLKVETKIYMRLPSYFVLNETSNYIIWNRIASQHMSILLSWIMTTWRQSSAEQRKRVYKQISAFSYLTGDQWRQPFASVIRRLI